MNLPGVAASVSNENESLKANEGKASERARCERVERKAALPTAAHNSTDKDALGSVGDTAPVKVNFAPHDFKERDRARIAQLSQLVVAWLEPRREPDDGDDHRNTCAFARSASGEVGAEVGERGARGSARAGALRTAAVPRVAFCGGDGADPHRNVNRGALHDTRS